MSPAKTIRWSGLAFAISGILVFVVALVHPNIFETTFSRVILDTPSWVLQHILTTIAFMLMLLGLVGLYSRQVDRIGWLGLVGFLMSFVGVVHALALAFFETYIMPVLAVEAPATLDWNGPVVNSPLVTAATAVVALYPLGLVVFGIATLRAALLPRWGAILLIVGAPLAAVFEGVFVPFLGVASTAVLVAGQVWLGYALWAERSQIAGEPRLVPAS